MERVNRAILGRPEQFKARLWTNASQHVRRVPFFKEILVQTARKAHLNSTDNVSTVSQDILLLHTDLLSANHARQDSFPIYLHQTSVMVAEMDFTYPLPTSPFV
jgi:hypothetical protein